jgi:hypothetical protein
VVYAVILIGEQRMNLPLFRPNFQTLSIIQQAITAAIHFTTNALPDGFSRSFPKGINAAPVPFTRQPNSRGGSAALPASKRVASRSRVNFPAGFR